MTPEDHDFLFIRKVNQVDGDAILVLCHSVGMTSNITFGAIYAFMEILAQPGVQSANLSGEQPGQVSQGWDGEENLKPSRRGRRIVNPSRLDKQRRNDGNLPSVAQPWVLPAQLN